MTAKQLLYFVTIAETGSFTLAAEKLNLSQPPLSKQIMLLEKELDTQLLIRSSRRIKLTESGVVLYSRAKDILRMMDSAAADMSSLSGKIGGTVRLGVVHSTGDLLLNGKLGEFLKTNPNITLDLYESNTGVLLDQIKNGSLDAAIVQTPFNADGLECCYLPEDTFAAIGKSEFFVEGLSKVSVNSLIGKPLIYCRSDERTILDQFEQAGLPYRCLCKTCDVRTALMMSFSGHGVALVPQRLAEASLKHFGEIRILPLEMPQMSMQLAFVYKKNTYHSQRVLALAELFQ